MCKLYYWSRKCAGSDGSSVAIAAQKKQPTHDSSVSLTADVH